MGGGIERIAYTEFEFALLGTQHDRLAFHAPNHIEGGPGLTSQGHFQEVVLKAGFDRLTQGALDLEEPVRRTKTADALVGPAVVIIFHPKSDPFPSRLETVELSTDQKFLPDRRPEPFHFAQGHGMLRAAFDVGHPVFLQFGFKTAGAAPTGVLATVIGEHFLGRLEFPDRHPVNLDDRLGRGAAK